MSKETDMLRKFASGCNENDIPSFLNLHGLRDRVAFAIEAVEAQVAEAVARVAALEKRPTIVSAGSQDDDRVRPTPVRRFKVGDRVRFVAEPKWVKGYLGTLGTIERIPGEATLEYYIASDVSGTNGDHVSANDADLEPAPSAVPAPRGFREGDIVRIKRTANGHEGWHGQEGPLVRDGIGLRPKLRFKGIGEPLVVAFHPHEYDLVRAAAAPEAPAEAPTTRPTPAMELDALRGEVARLTAERDDWKYAAEVQKKDTEGWKARAEAAEDFLGMESDAHKATRAKLAAAEQALDVERRTSIDHDGKTFVHPTREARLTSTAESWSPWMKHHKRVEAERDALRAELSALKAKPRFRTRKVRAKDAEAFDKEYHKREYASGYEDYARAMNAVGLRMRVDGGK